MTDNIVPFGPFGRSFPELQALLNDPDPFVAAFVHLKVASFASAPVTVDPAHVKEVLFYLDQLEARLTPCIGA